MSLDLYLRWVGGGPGRVASLAFSGGFYDAFRSAPAAREHHHAYPGGLLDHTVEVVELCLKASCLYPELDLDLLLAGALLHDVGKVDEYAFSPSGVVRTPAGELLGHVFVGASRVASLCAEAGVVGEPAMKLVHLVLSHHGRREWGSPVEPAIPEAVLLHQADLLSARAAAAVKGAVRRGT